AGAANSISLEGPGKFPFSGRLLMDRAEPAKIRQTIEKQWGPHIVRVVEKRRVSEDIPSFRISEPAVDGRLRVAGYQSQRDKLDSTCMAQIQRRKTYTATVGG